MNCNKGGKDLIPRKTSKMLQIEAHFDTPIKELLTDLYKTKTMPEIVEYLKSEGIKVSQGSLSQWFLRLDIPTRTWQIPTGTRG